MNIVFYVHDCYLEIGHSNAMIETLRNFPEKNKVNFITIVAYTCAPLEELLPDYSGRIKFVKIPKPILPTHLFKDLWFQLCTLVHLLFFLPKDSLKIGIGTACLWVDICNIQFIHHQWYEHYFKVFKQLNFKTIYKFALYRYLLFCEKYLFKKKKPAITCLASFVKDYMHDHFGYNQENSILIYSGVNQNRFTISNTPREECFRTLKEIHPEISNLNLTCPIFLFVGAYERKGLPKALEELSRLDNPQIIIVGSPQFGGTLSIPKNINAFKVPFSKNINLFYQLSDCFIFPSIYEPFGLVLLEAAIMGLVILAPRHNVGASEILLSLKDIHLIEDDSSYPVEEVVIIDDARRRENRQTRLERLNQYSWKKAGEQFYNFLVKIKRETGT